MKEKITVVSSSLDYGYSNIQNTYEGKASNLMFFPTGSFEWIKNFIKK
jgi:hypothetical protein